MLVKGRKVVEVLPTIGKEEERMVEGFITFIEDTMGTVELRREQVNGEPRSYIDVYARDVYMGSLQVCDVQGTVRVLMGARNRIDSMHEALRIGMNEDLMSSQLNVLRWEIEEDKIDCAIAEVLYVMGLSQELDFQSWNCEKMRNYLKEERHREDLLLDLTISLWTEIKRRWDLIK